MGAGRAPLTSLRSVWAFLGRHFRSVAAVATVLGIALALSSQREALAEFDWRIEPAVFALAVALLAVGPILQSISYWLLLRMLGLPSSFSETVLLWMRSFLVRYAPSGALTVVLRVRERERVSATPTSIYTSTAYEQLVALLGGAVACLCAFAVARSWPPLLAVSISLGVLLLGIAVRPRFFRHWGVRLLAWRGIDPGTLLRGRQLIAAVLFNLPGWAATGLGAWLLLRALSSEDLPGVAWITGVYAFSWMVGFLLPLLPGGLGAREGVFVALIATSVGVGPATALSLALRLASTVAEFVAIGGVEVLYAAHTSRRRRAARPTP